jgi:hypothetical protein
VARCAGRRHVSTTPIELPVTTSSIHPTLPNGESVDVPDQPNTPKLAQPATRPADFAVYHAEFSAPLPPPHSWQRCLWIGPGLEGVVEMIPGDRSPGNPVWQERFPLQEAHLDWLHQVLRDQGAFGGEWQASRDVRVGGGGAQLTVTANGRHTTIPPFVSEDRDRAQSVIVTATRALVPPAIWERLTAAHAAYKAKYTP